MFDRVLIMETSGRMGQVAVAAGNAVLASRLLPEVRRHARDLAARSGELLAEQGWKARDLTAVVVNIGPGSFTGLRVGLASAKALTYATDCALFGVPAFDAVAVRIPENPQPLEIIADALQGQVYCQRFTWGEDHWLPADSLQIQSLAEWIMRVQPGSLVAGPGVSVYRDKIGIQVMFAEASCSEADSASLLRAALLEPARYQVSPWDIGPIYLRGSSAEEKRKQG